MTRSGVFKVWIVAMVVVCPGGPARVMAAGSSEVVAVWDGFGDFGNAVVRNAMEGSVQESASAGGARRRSIFLHPKNEKDATATYQVELPKLNEGDRLVFSTWVGLRDGARLDDPEHPSDGVGFAVEVAGERLFHEVVKATRWAPVALDLARWAGQDVALSLVTDSGGAGNVNYDWALFGQPRILLLRGNALDSNNTAHGTGGVALLDYSQARDNADLAVVATDARGASLPESRVAMPLRNSGVALIEFDLSKIPGAVGFRVEAQGAQAKELRACVYSPRLEVVRVGAARGVCFAGESLKIAVRVKNIGKGTLLPEHKGRIEHEQSIDIPRLMPGEEKLFYWSAPSREKGESTLRATAHWTVADEVKTADAEGKVKVVAPMPQLPDEAPAQTVCRRVDDTILLENANVRLAFLEEGAGPMLVYAREKTGWSLVATSPTLCDLVVEGQQLPSPLLRSNCQLTKTRATFTQTFKDLPGEARVQFDLPSSARRVSISTTFTANPDTSGRLVALRGPAILVGDNATGEAKKIAIFPGLEYLEADEDSSSTRDLAPPLNNRLVPDPYKVTIPMMAIETERATVALLWSPNQKWDGEHSLVSALFSSPNHVDDQANHRLQLFVPAGRDFIDENKTVARSGVEAPAGKSLTLRQELLVAPGKTALDAVKEWCEMSGGVPQAQKPPRDREQELSLCRTGFLKSVWDDKTQKSSHYVGCPPANAPGFATLLLYDALTAKDAEGARQARDRANLIASQTLKQEGEQGLISGANCHIMRWELPFHWGHLAGAVLGMRNQMHGVLGGMDEEGAWRFNPDESHRQLGDPGTAELGTCGYAVLTLLRYARLAGDAEAAEAGRKALKFIEQHFKVPRGAQGWECPIHEPDILASAYAVGAYVEAYRLTGDRHYLDEARYWAATGLPFHYLWDDPAKPGMRHASIPVFGSTFFTHSWLGLPVQWCGLVYAYHLQHLAQYDNTFPWKEVARGITVSAMYQQVAEGEDPKLTGCYPDSWGNCFTHKNGVFINPEDIAVNLLALEGHDPEPTTAIVTSGENRYHVSSGAQLTKAGLSHGTLRFEAKYFPGETSYTLLSGVAEPSTVTINGKPAKSGQSFDVEPSSARDEQTDYVYSPDLAMLFVKIKHGSETSRVEVNGVKPAKPKEPEARTAWDFKEGAQGWTTAHSCDLTVQDGALVVTITGRDPYFLSGETSVPASKYPRVIVRARADAGRAVGLFWRTDRSPGWGEDKQVEVALSPGNEYREFVIDLAAHPLWKGKVTQLRLDLEPEDVPQGTKLQIERVSFGQGG